MQNRPMSRLFNCKRRTTCDTAEHQHIVDLGHQSNELGGLDEIGGRKDPAFLGAEAGQAS